MEGIDFLQDLALVLLVAGGAGWLCYRIGLSAVVGFLLAGILIGPYTPPFAMVSDLQRIQTLSQLGLVFLMFSIGMGLSLRRLRRMGLPVLIATAMGAVLVFSGTKLMTTLLGWTPIQGLFAAAMLMVSSSAIINKVLHELNALHETSSRYAMSITVLEDVVAVVMLTVLTSATQVTGAAETPIAQTLGLIVTFVAVLVIGGLLLVPRFLSKLTRSVDVDLQTVLIVAMILGVSIVAVKAGYSLALGAFLLGAIVAETAQRAQVDRYLQGIRDIFTAVFFVSIGMMMDVRLVTQSWPLVLLFGVFTLVWRPLALSASLLLIGHPTRDAVRAGVMLTPIGEFSFIIAQLGVASKAAPPELYPLAVGLSLFTSLSSPFMIKHSEAISHMVERAEPRLMKEAIGFYHRALERIAARQQGNALWQLSSKRLVQIFTGGLFVTGLLVFAQPAYTALKQRIGPSLPYPEAFGFIFWISLGLVVLVPLLAIWRHFSALSLIYSEAFSKGTAQEPALRIGIEKALQIIFGALIALWLWALLPLNVEAWWNIAVILALLGLMFLLLRRRLIFLHNRIEVQLQQTLTSGEQPARTHESWLRKHKEWNIHAHELVLPDNSEAAGKALSDLALRTRFGCSVVGAERHGFAIPNPTPDLVLYPGDKLLVLGTPEQMDRVREFINKASPVDTRGHVLEEIELEKVVVPQNSPAAGKLLVELELPAHTGVQVVGIERDGNRLLNPGPFQGIEAGDRLLALGTPDQVAALERWLTGETG